MLFQFASERSGSLACRVAPHLRLVWRRGPLAPLVGEGQVNLDFGPVVAGLVAMAKVSKAFVVDDLEF